MAVNKKEIVEKMRVAKTKDNQTEGRYKANNVTVRDLVKALKQFDQDMIVSVIHDDNNCYDRLRTIKVSLSKDGGGVYIFAESIDTWS